MNDIRVKHFKKSFLNDVSAMLNEAKEEFRTNILFQINSVPNNTYILTNNGSIVGVGLFFYSKGKKITSFNMYVKESERKNGYGSLLLKSILSNLKSIYIDEIFCEISDSESIKKFFEKNGFEVYYTKHKMNKTIYQKDLIDSFPEIINYSDKYYFQLNQLIEKNNFHSQQNNQPKEFFLQKDNSELRELLDEDRKHCYVQVMDDDIVGFIYFENELINHLLIDDSKLGPNELEYFIYNAYKSYTGKNNISVDIYVQDNQISLIEQLDELGFMKIDSSYILRKEM